jgi:hypothetical protein
MCLGLCLGLRLQDAAAAQPNAPANAATSLLAVQDADPLELARVVHRVGDSAVVVLLEPHQPAAVRFAAVRAAPWLAEPERALPALSALIRARDSDLAPAAASAALQISQALDAGTLARREVLPAELTAVVLDLRATAKLSWVRADLQLMAALTAAQLEAAGVPAPPSK